MNTNEENGLNEYKILNPNRFYVPLKVFLSHPTSTSENTKFIIIYFRKYVELFP